MFYAKPPNEILEEVIHHVCDHSSLSVIQIDLETSQILIDRVNNHFSCIVNLFSIA